MVGQAYKVAPDVAEQVKELHAQGLSFCRISAITEVPRSTCYAIVKGRHRQFSDDLSARQRTRLLSELRP